ncbi:hypothetical protein BJ170DRAFT_355203 [Xylariales sp. AK1849]|nr:hypothetical protein BJ170DRAFT_355203 [Xylariales sp. AK1849]
MDHATLPPPKLHTMVVSLSFIMLTCTAPGGGGRHAVHHTSLALNKILVSSTVYYGTAKALRTKGLAGQQSKVAGKEQACGGQAYMEHTPIVGRTITDAVMVGSEWDNIILMADIPQYRNLKGVQPFLSSLNLGALSLPDPLRALWERSGIRSVHSLMRRRRYNLHKFEPRRPRTFR